MRRPAGDPASLRVVIDAAHPAHVHVFRHVAADLRAQGAEVRWLSRAKDATVPLLDRFGIAHTVVSRAVPTRGPVADAGELLARVRAVRRVIRTWRPQVLLTRNPAGVLAGLGTRTRTIFDTDDGRAVGRHYWLAAMFADVVTSSVHDPESHGPRHRRYPGLKAEAFLHPSRFTPDPTVREQLGVPDEPLAVVRFSRHDASHDGGIRGIDGAMKPRLLALLLAHGSVLLSVEGEPSRVMTRDGASIPVPADVFHDLLAGAWVCVTDGQSVAAEAAVLGVPTLRLSGFTGRVWYLAHLERLGLVRSFSPGEEAVLLAAVSETVRTAAPTAMGRRDHAPRRDAAGAEDVASWFTQLVLEATRPPSRHPRGSAAAAR